MKRAFNFKMADCILPVKKYSKVSNLKYLGTCACALQNNVLGGASIVIVVT